MTDYTPATVQDVEPALKTWQRGIAENNLESIAAAFTTDALFQGLRPQPSYGPDGVKEYYGSQPAPLTVDYQIVHFRSLTDQAAIVYLEANFHPAGRNDLRTHITLVLQPVDGRWLINHYHVSVIN